MSGWHFGACDEESDRPWFRQHNNWIPLLIFMLLMLVFIRSGSWWMFFFLWWIIPTFSGWNSGCATGFEKAKRDAMYEKPKREPVYIYDDNGEPLEVIDAQEKPKRHAGDAYDYV